LPALKDFFAATAVYWYERSVFRPVYFFPSHDPPNVILDFFLVEVFFFRALFGWSDDFPSPGKFSKHPSPRRLFFRAICFFEIVNWQFHPVLPTSRDHEFRPQYFYNFPSNGRNPARPGL